MKKPLVIILILALTFSLLTACADKPNESVEKEHEYGKIIYVSPDGNDENNGEKGSPVASLVGAVKAMRDYRSKNGLPESGIKIEFAEGTYNVTESITLTAGDSGTEESPIVFTSAKDAYVLFDGGVSIKPSDFKPADDAFKSILPTEEAKANVLMLDLAAAGCYDLDDSSDYKAEMGYTTTEPTPSPALGFYRQELFVNGKRQTVARWPNNTYCHPDVDLKTVITDENGTQFYKIFVSDEKASFWQNVETIRLYGMPKNDYASVFIPDVNLAEDSSALLFPLTASSRGLSEDCLYYVSNIPQELDSAGEYYWDTKTNIFYYWPEEDLENSVISFSQFAGVPISLSGCSHITVDNITAGYFRNSFIKGDGDYITVSNCSVYGIGGNAAISLNGDFNTVKGCLLHDLASAGIIIRTGDIATQNPGHTSVSDNIVHDWAQLFTVYNAAVAIRGFGGKILHNELYNSAHYAVEIRGGQCEVAYNDIHNACLEVADGGAVETWGYLSWAGNEYKYNYLHQIGDNLNPAFGIERPGLGSGFFFDFWGRYAICYGNLFVDVKGCCMCGVSGHITCQNNLCINVGEPINIADNGVTERSDGYDNTWVKDDIRLYDYLNQIWRYSSSRTALFIEVNDQKRNIYCMDLPLAAAYNIFQNNVRFIDSNAEVKPFDCDDNEYYTKYGIIHASDYSFNMSSLLDNVCYTDVDPGFTDYANGDYTLREDSRVFRDLIGFENIDMSVFGPRTSENPFKK